MPPPELNPFTENSQIMGGTAQLILGGGAGTTTEESAIIDKGYIDQGQQSNQTLDMGLPAEAIQAD